MWKRPINKIHQWDNLKWNIEIWNLQDSCLKMSQVQNWRVYLEAFFQTRWRRRPSWKMSNPKYWIKQPRWFCDTLLAGNLGVQIPFLTFSTLIITWPTCSIHIINVSIGYHFYVFCRIHHRQNKNGWWWSSDKLVAKVVELYLLESFWLHMCCS